MSESARVSAPDLCSAFERGELPRDQYWLEMRERHRLLEQYVELVGRGELGAIEIRPGGLEVVFKDGLRMRFRPDDTRSVPSVTVNHGAYEPKEVAALTTLASQSRVILDIGANAGFMSLKMARALSSDRSSELRSTYSSIRSPDTERQLSTASSASVSPPKKMTPENNSAGIGSSFRSASSTTPSVPSDPQIRLMKSIPGESG